MGELLRKGATLALWIQTDGHYGTWLYDHLSEDFLLQRDKELN